MAPLPFSTHSDEIWVSNSKACRIWDKLKIFETAELKGRRVSGCQWFSSQVSVIPCVVWAKIYNLSVSQFAHLENEAKILVLIFIEKLWEPFLTYGKAPISFYWETWNNLPHSCGTVIAPFPEETTAQSRLGEFQSVVRQVAQEPQVGRKMWF